MSWPTATGLCYRLQTSSNLSIWADDSGWVAETGAVRISDFSKTTTLGNWSADILVRSRSSVNP